jgi:uncharacterized protein (UPF0261 family)
VKRILLVGTADTKGAELSFVHKVLLDRGIAAELVDIGTRSPTIAVEVSAQTIADCHPNSPESALTTDDRGTAVAAMASAFAEYCKAHANDIGGVIGIGGGGGTAMITAGMRELPYGVPKVMVSTLASGDVAPYIGTSDIAMFPSVTDIAGLNRLSRQILSNAAGAFSGMLNSTQDVVQDDKPAIGLSMFGVTTPAVTAMAEHLQDRFDCLIFHATGIGGRTMEQLAGQGYLNGIVDITTTEICDLLFGGVLPALNTRLDVIATTKLPYVGSVGALDMVNFWAPDTIPAHLSGRQFYHHNSNVTLMRTTPDECAEVGVWIGKKLNACDGPVRLLLPTKGVSALDIEDGPFWNPKADAALFDALHDTIIQTDNRQIIDLPYHINDLAFAKAAVRTFQNISEA